MILSEWIPVVERQGAGVVFMNITETILPGVLKVKPERFLDDRGFFEESWNLRRLEDIGFSEAFVQDNHSRSLRGVLRGLHYQRENPQGKLVRVTRGCVFDVAVDIRSSSENFGRWVGVILSDIEGEQLWVPPGFAHGFYVLSDVADVNYKCTTYWSATDEHVLIWNDPDVGITWPFPDDSSQPILSSKDRNADSLRSCR